MNWADNIATPLRRVAAIAMVIAFMVPSIGSAQDVATGQATANVLANLQVTATQDLNFGSVFQGVAKSVGNNDDANSGIFQIVGANSAGISIYITLPAYIALASGARWRCRRAGSWRPGRASATGG